MLYRQYTTWRGKENLKRTLTNAPLIVNVRDSKISVGDTSSLARILWKTYDTLATHSILGLGVDLGQQIMESRLKKIALPAADRL